MTAPATTPLTDAQMGVIRRHATMTLGLTGRFLRAVIEQCDRITATLDATRDDLKAALADRDRLIREAADHEPRLQRLATQLAAAGRGDVAPQMAGHLARIAELQLTPAERRALLSLANGESLDALSERTGLSLRTLGGQRIALYRRMNVGGGASSHYCAPYVVALAMAAGLIRADELTPPPPIEEEH